MVMICSISLIWLVQRIPVRLTLSVLSISSPSRCSVAGTNYDEDSEEQDEYEDHDGDEYDFQPIRVDRSLSVGHPSFRLKQLEARNVGYTADDPVPGRTDPGGTDGSLKVGLSEEEAIFAFDRFSYAQEFGCSVQWVECIGR